MNHHLHNFIWGLLFSAAHWKYVNYQHYLFVHATCKSIPRKTISEQVREGDRDRTKCQGGSESGERRWRAGNCCGSVKRCAGNAHGEGDAESPGSGAGRGCGSLGSYPSLAPRSLLLQTLLPALGVLRKHRESFREAQESCGSPRGGLARGRCGGNVTQRWQCHQRGGAAPAQALRELPALRWVQETEEFILSSCQSITSTIGGFSTFPPPPPRCQLSQMCSVLDAAKFPVPRQGNHSIS